MYNRCDCSVGRMTMVLEFLSSSFLGLTYLQWLFVIQVIVTILLIISEKIDKTLIILVSSTVTVVLLRFGMNEDPAKLMYEEFLDFHTLVLIIGLMIVIESIKDEGFFDYVSLLAVRLTKGDPLKLFIVFGLLDVFISAFLDNVTTIIVLGSLTIVICKRLELNPIPFIIFEAYLTGTAALLTPVGSVPNIIINSEAGLSFLDFMLYMLPLTVFSIIVCYGYFLLRFRQQIAVEVPESLKEPLLLVQPSLALKHENVQVYSIIALSTLVIGFILAGFIGMSIDLVAMMVAVLVLIFFKMTPKEGFKHVNWDMVFFFAGLFIVIGGLERSKALDPLVEFIKELMLEQPLVALIVIIFVGGVLSGFLDSIPMALILTELLVLAGNQEVGFWLSLVVATNLGGALAPIGSVSVLMAIEILHDNDYDISLIDYIKISLPLFVILSTIGVLYMYALIVLL